MVVVIRGEVPRAAFRAAEVHGLCVLWAPSAAQAYRMLRHLQPPAVVVPVAEAIGEAVELIRLLAGIARRVPLIVVASVHREEIERAVWKAGATCYLPGTEWHLLEPIWATIQAREARSQRNQAGRAGSRGGATGVR